jgi:hypothetical protein
MNDSISTGRTLDKVANVGLGVGLGGLVIGGVLIAVDLATAEPTGASSAAGPAQAVWIDTLPGGAVVGYELGF